ncbi:hypothetical protein ACRRTK_009079 [Alexandromys fortis]
MREDVGVCTAQLMMTNLRDCRLSEEINAHDFVALLKTCWLLSEEVAHTVSQSDCIVK